MHQNEKMKQNLYKVLSFAGLLCVLVPSILTFKGVIDIEQSKLIMLVGTIVWLFVSPLWVDRLSND